MSSIRTRVVLFAEVGHSFDQWTGTTGWKIDNQAEILAGRESDLFEVFFFGRMPKKNRSRLKRLASKS